PLVVSPLHEIAAIERARLLVQLDLSFMFTATARRLGLCDQTVELFRINAVGKILTEQIIAVAVEQEVLSERLPTIERLAYVRDGRMEILLDRIEIRLAPERVNDRVLGGAAMTARGDEAEYVARTFGRPSIGGERARRVAENLDGAEHLDGQIGCGLGRQRGRKVCDDKRRGLRRGRDLLAQIYGQQLADFGHLEERGRARDLALKPVLVVVAHGEIERAPQVREHLRFIAGLLLASGERHAGLRLVVVETLHVKIFEHG